MGEWWMWDGSDLPRIFIQRIYQLGVKEHLGFLRLQSVWDCNPSMIGSIEWILLLSNYVFPDRSCKNIVERILVLGCWFVERMVEEVMQKIYGFLSPNVRGALINDEYQASRFSNHLSLRIGKFWKINFRRMA